jgi:hypothetical protein
MAGDPGWHAVLEAAATIAVAEHNVHEAVTLFDTLLFGHLLSGNPQLCRPLADRMIDLTEQTTAAWNGYFRAASLLAALHVEGDHRGVLAEATTLLRRPLSLRSREMLTGIRVLAMADAGDDLDAVNLGEHAQSVASDDSARAMASWTLAEACWLAGFNERTISVAERCVALPVAASMSASTTPAQRAPDGHAARLLATVAGPI